MSNDLLDYHRQLALACLHRVPDSAEAPSAAEVAEHMVALAQAEGHPKRCWAILASANVSGILRSLKGEGKVEKVTGRLNARNGRHEPGWAIYGVRNPTAPPPSPPDGSRPEPVPTEEETLYDSLTKTQLCELLRIHDKVAGACHRFMRDIQEINEDARGRLARVGLVPE